jgi:hypothetical protein
MIIVMFLTIFSNRQENYFKSWERVNFQVLIKFHLNWCRYGVKHVLKDRVNCRSLPIEWCDRQGLIFCRIFVPPCPEEFLYYHHWLDSLLCALAFFKSFLRSPLFNIRLFQFLCPRSQISWSTLSPISV